MGFLTVEGFHFALQLKMVKIRLLFLLYFDVPAVMSLCHEVRDFTAPRCDLRLTTDQ